MLGEKNSVEIYSVVGEPTTETTEQGLAAARQFKPEVVIGIGGGSPIDCGKAIAMLLSNGGEPLDYLEVIGKGKKNRKAFCTFYCHSYNFWNWS